MWHQVPSEELWSNGPPTAGMTTQSVFYSEPRGLTFRAGVVWQCLVLRTTRPGGKACALPKLPRDLPPLACEQRTDPRETPTDSVEGGFFLPEEVRNVQIILGDDDKPWEVLSGEQPMSERPPQPHLRDVTFNRPVLSQSRYHDNDQWFLFVF